MTDMTKMKDYVRERVVAHRFSIEEAQDEIEIRHRHIALAMEDHRWGDVMMMAEDLGRYAHELAAFTVVLGELVVLLDKITEGEEQ